MIFIPGGGNKLIFLNYPIMYPYSGLGDFFNAEKGILCHKSLNIKKGDWEGVRDDEIFLYGSSQYQDYNLIFFLSVKKCRKEARTY